VKDYLRANFTSEVTRPMDELSAGERRSMSRDRDSASNDIRSSRPYSKGRSRSSSLHTGQYAADVPNLLMPVPEVVVTDGEQKRLVPVPTEYDRSFHYFAPTTLNTKNCRRGEYVAEPSLLYGGEAQEDGSIALAIPRVTRPIEASSLMVFHSSDNNLVHVPGTYESDLQTMYGSKYSDIASSTRAGCVINGWVS